MKRMHYIAGAVGLAPAVLGIAVAPAAGAATVTPAGSAKTVSLHHVLAPTTRANMAAASSSSSTAASPDTTAGCKGNTYFHMARHNNLVGHGWYANSTLDFHTCIGTVDVYAKFNKTFCKNVTLGVSASGVQEWSRTHSVCGTAGRSVMTQFNVHDSIYHLVGEGVAVCVSSTYDRAGTCSTVGS
jgi:hypothetical protein